MAHTLDESGISPASLMRKQEGPFPGHILAGLPAGDRERGKAPQFRKHPTFLEGGAKTNGSVVGVVSLVRGYYFTLCKLK